MQGLGVRTDIVRAVDHVIPPGVYPDMREYGWERDDFPGLYRELIEPADIVVLASPIWLGDQSSMTRLLIERLYGWSGALNDAGQWSYYGKVGGVLITGNEDGGKHCAAQMLYALSHIGFTIPPQSDSYWVGEAGPGPSYLDDNRGASNAWTTRNTVFATWNMLHAARRLKDAGGIPAVRERLDQLGPVQPRASQSGVPVNARLLYFDGCPSWRATADHLAELAEELGLTWEAVLVEDSDDLAALGFRGSPTVLVDGQDPFASDEAPFAFACRVYVTPQGLAGSPTKEQLRQAIAGDD